MNTTFIINGGAGRIVTSIPALEKYHRLNPMDDFKILVHGFEQVFWGHPTLQQRTFSAYQKGLFNQFIKNSRVITPEPYQLHSFFNQQTNLVEAFDEIINKTNVHDDLNYNCLYLTSYEINRARELILLFKEQSKTNKLVVFQPFGSGVELVNKKPVDRSNRSLTIDTYIHIVKTLKNDAAIVYASHPQFKPKLDNMTFSLEEHQNYLRILMAIIHECDLFVGICSVGQHIARMFNKSSIIIMGGTNEINFSYPNNHKIYRKKNRDPIYVPWRLSDGDCEFSDRINDNIMNFEKSEIDQITVLIKNNLLPNNDLNKVDFLNYS